MFPNAAEIGEKPTVKRALNSELSRASPLVTKQEVCGQTLS